MNSQDDEKIVLITGASSGIGQATALMFAENGYRLALTYRANKAGCKQTVEQCNEKGAASVEFIQLDLADDQSIKTLSAMMGKNYGKIDVLVNNAGTLSYGELASLENSEIDKLFATNLIGVIKTTKELLPLVKESIINIGSSLGLHGKRNLSIYSSSKFGIRGFTQALADEKKDLKVYAVNPSLTATQMGGYKGMKPEVVAKIIFNAAIGQYRAASGSDINALDYQFGEIMSLGIKAYRRLKLFIKTLKSYIK